MSLEVSKVENKIKELRDGRPIQWIADRTGLHRNTISSIEKGGTTYLETADIIAFAFGKTIYEVFPGLRSEPSED